MFPFIPPYPSTRIPLLLDITVSVEMRLFSYISNPSVSSDSVEEIKATEPMDDLGEQSERLLLRLLIKYLQSAASKPAEAAANNAIHLLHCLPHPYRPTSRSNPTHILLHVSNLDMHKAHHSVCN